MKFCSMPFVHMYVGCDNGNVTPCHWMWPDQCQVGYLWRDGGPGDCLTDIINSPKMKELRDSILDGSFRFCRFDACPHMQRNEFEDLSKEEIEKITNTEYPEFINLAYDFVCNQSCPSCRSEVYVPPEDYSEKMKTIEDQIMPYVTKARKISASGMGDPMASPYMMSVLENLHPVRDDFELILETNGVFFDEEHWKRISHLSKYYFEVTVTVNSFSEEIYNNISRGGNLKKLLKNLEFIRSLREKGEINRVNCAFVIQDRNFRELPSGCCRCLDEYKADCVLLRPIYQWGRFSEEEYWFKDVLNPLHPYHEEYLEILKDPVLNDPRVYNFAGGSSHEPRSFPGVCDNQKIEELKCTIQEKERVICELQCALEQARACSDSAEAAMNDQECRLQALQAKINSEICDLYKQLSDIQNSNSFKVGRAITYLPRKIRDAGKAE